MTPTPTSEPESTGPSPLSNEVESLRGQLAARDERIRELQMVNAGNPNPAEGAVRGSKLERELWQRSEEMLSMLRQLREQIKALAPDVNPGTTNAVDGFSFREAGDADSKSMHGEKPDKTGYLELPASIREVIARLVPEGARIIVVSKGDEELLKFSRRTGIHFPSMSGGRYAGHYPADCNAAIVHLEELRAAGHEFFLIPSTGLWWLDHYSDFAKHLEQNYSLVFRDEAICVIYDLRGGSKNPPTVAPAKARTTNSYDYMVRQLGDVMSSMTHPSAKIVVVSKGDEKLLGRRAGWHFPSDANGVYAGHYPVDDAAAIASLEALREKGAGYIVFPATSVWWLDHYPDFALHLKTRYRMIVSQKHIGVVFALKPKTAGTRE